MDKHDRKRLSRWEAKKAKSQLKFEEKLREHYYDAALDTIDAFGNSYKPHPARVLSGVTKQAEEFLKELRQPPPPPPGRLLMASRIYLAQWFLMDDFDFPWFYTMVSDRVHRFAMWRSTPYQQFIVYDERSLDRRINVSKTIDAIRDHKDNQLRKNCLRGILRNAIRLDPLREDLAAATQKSRAIQNCLAIKEELMMNVWHPRRVEYILETYGWDAYDNLVGL